MIQQGPLGTGAPLKKKGNLVFKLAIAVVAILLLSGMAIAGGAAYLRYIAKMQITDSFSPIYDKPEVSLAGQNAL
jgi:hypothetical protein